ncbi:hypothetical protein INT47_008647 [Mucor saturninus]|uniref:Uncharacterized protein n=1 Tax=Mucor saturninus TaxID=64648 RepID=A0A8H7QTL1_9FUNG|nr:hypothetical protein INT47_008647 [Mucor saturninus]
MGRSQKIPPVAQTARQSSGPPLLKLETRLDKLETRLTRLEETLNDIIDSRPFVQLEDSFKEETQRALTQLNSDIQSVASQLKVDKRKQTINKPYNLVVHGDYHQH